jgi:hypothetical protein
MSGITEHFWKQTQRNEYGALGVWRRHVRTQVSAEVGGGAVWRHSLLSQVHLHLRRSAFNILVLLTKALP